MTREIEKGGSTIQIRAELPTADEKERKAPPGSSAEESRPIVQDVVGGRSSVHRSMATTPEDGLLGVVTRGVQKKIAAYEALDQTGYIRPATEFLNLEMQP